MKKIISILIVAFATLAVAVPVPASAASGITKDEQRIMDALNQGTTVSGVTFNFGADDIAQARNYLQRNDVSNEAVNESVANIEAARTFAMKQSIDTSGLKDGDDVRLGAARMSRSAKEQLVAYYNKVFQALGLNGSGDQTGGMITDKEGNPVFRGYSTTNAAQNSGVVKKTGANYIDSVLFFVSLLAVSVLAVIAGRRFLEADAV